ncbi:5-methylcytosine catabolic process [Mactra antiquata]
MHGAASPFMTGWAGLSPYDGYPPVLPSGQQLPVHQHPVPVQPNISSHLPSMNPRLPSPMDTYFQQMLHGVSGYMHKLPLEAKHHITERSDAHHIDPTHLKKTDDFDSYINRKRQASHLDTHNNGAWNPHHAKWQHGTGKIESFPEPVSTRDNVNIRFSPFHSLDSTPFNVASTAPITCTSSSDLIWKNVFSSSISTSNTSSGMFSPVSTSKPSIPVVSSKTTASSNGIISYYSSPHDRSNYLGHNSVEAASKEAARIIEEAQFTSGPHPHDRKLPSPFNNISNDFKRQPPNGMFHPNQMNEVKKQRPSPNQSVGSLPNKSPVDFCAENALLGGIPFNSTKDSVQDFWSQFGLPPPNVDLEKMSHLPDKRGNDALNSSDGLSNPSKRFKSDDNLESTVSTASPSNVTHSIGETNDDKRCEERKKPEKLTRRKSFTDDPEIDALVEVKVQEIMAACRQKNEPQGMIDKSKPVKSTRPVHMSSKPLNSSERLPIYNKQQHHHGQSLSASGMTTSTGHVGGSVFDFNDVDEPKKGHSFMVKDMMNVKTNEPENVSHVRQHSHMPGQWQKFDNSNNAQAGNFRASSINNSQYQTGQPTQTKKEPYGHFPTTVGKSVPQKAQPLSSLPLSHSNSVKNSDPGFKSSAGPNLNENLYANKQFGFNSGNNLPNDKLTSDKCVTGIHKPAEIGSGRVSPCCGKCESVGARFSENCQNHAKRKEIKVKDDPYQFSDDFNDRNNHWNNITKLNNKIQSEQNDMKYKVQYTDAMAIMGVGKFPPHFEKNRDVYQKHIFKSEKSQKLKPLNGKFEKSHGNNNLNKKVAGKSFGLKSSLALLKKSQKFQQSKTSAAMKRKWVNNPNYKKIPKDDFAEKLKKNLGLPPLTLMDMMTKKCSKLPKSYLKRKQKHIESNKVNENQVLNKINDLNASLSNVQSDDKKELNTKPVQRSKSVDEALNSKLNVTRPRSNSVENVKHLNSESAPKSGLSVKVDNGRPMELNHDRVKFLSEQINGLKDQVTGMNSHLETNTVVDVPKCGCLGPEGVCLETVEGPYYTQLGIGRSVEAIRIMMEQRTGVSGKAIRIEKARYTGKEGKSSQGCPIAKWIIRRSSVEEKYLTVVRHRTGHTCEYAWIVIGIVAWEGVPAKQADHLYDFLSDTLPAHGNETERRCGTNDRKTCACQGADLMKRGASFSFGCSWSMYFNGCKFARSTHVRKFRLKSEEKETVLEDKLQELAGQVGPLYEQCAPSGHSNQCHFSSKAQDCRLGMEKGGPFSGVTACVDFCAHAHKDIHNMNNGSTVVVTLTKHRGLSKPEDEQLHVLPLYVLEPTDESGSYEGQYQKIQNGSLEVLHQYPLEARMRAFPLESCKKRRMSKKGKNKNGMMNGQLSPWESSSSTQSTPKKARQDPYHSTASLNSSADNTPIKQKDLQHSVNFDIKSDKPVSIDDLRSMSSQADLAALYDKFWDYYYAFGVFPPSSILAANSISSSKSSEISASQRPQDFNKPSDQGQVQGHVDIVPAEQHVTNSPHSVPLKSSIGQSQDYSQNLPRHADTNSQVNNEHSEVLSQDHQLVRPQDKLSNVPQQLGTGNQYLNTGTLKMDGNKSSESHTVHGSSSVITTVPQSLSQMQYEKSALDLSSTSTPSVQQGAHQTLSSSLSVDLHDQASSKKSFSISSLVQTSDVSTLTPCSTNQHQASNNRDFGNSNQSDIQGKNSHMMLNSDINMKSSVSTSPSYSSPLDMLSRTVDIHSKDVGYTGSVKYSSDGDLTPNVTSSKMFANVQISKLPSGMMSTNHSNTSVSRTSTFIHHPNHTKDQGQHTFKNDQNVFPHMNDKHGDLLSQAQNIPSNNNQFVNQQQEMYYNKNFPIPSNVEPSLPDPDVVKCEMEYNEDAFQDPDVGGVAIALSHGAVLFEVAKRELHATTGLRNPNRYHPTRISLVFYQHKNLNTESHGMYAYENKLQNMKMKRIEKMQLERGYVDMDEIENSFKGGKKRKMTDEEIEINELLKSSSGEYKYMLQCNAKMADTGTTNTISTNWIDPTPMVTGPYQKWK